MTVNKYQTIRDILLSKKNQSGFSIVEIMVFITLISVILVAAAGFTVEMLRTMSYNKNKLYAVHYIQDLKEWLDGEREADWQTFQSYSSTAGTYYCINNPIAINSSLANLSQTDTCAFNGITGQNPIIFRRRLRLIKDVAGTANRVTAVMEVSWMEDNVLRTEQVTSVYSLWQ